MHRNHIIARRPLSERPVAMNRLSFDRQALCLRLLLEGMSLRGASRITGHHVDTIMRLSVRAGQRCLLHHDAHVRNLKLKHIQVDEMWCWCYMKQKQIPDQMDDAQIGDQWLYFAIDQDSKLIVSYLVGKRTDHNAERFMLDLSRRIHIPDLFDESPDRPMISSDGHRPYVDAHDTAFAGAVRLGQLIKASHKDDPTCYNIDDPKDGISRQMVVGDTGEDEICTSHVERFNATVRNLTKRCARRTFAFSKKLDNLRAAVSLFVAYYNYCWIPRTMSVTPAVEAGLTRQVWSTQDLLNAVDLENSD